MAVFTSWAGCSDSSVAPLIDAAPRADAAVPIIDGTVYPDTRPADTFSVLFLDPDHGPYTGGTEVQIRGIGFAEGARVLIGGRAVPDTDIEIIDQRRIRVLTPPGEPGLADVVVEQGDLTAELAAGFGYEALTVDPPEGSVAGGTFITISGLGTDFGPGTSVTLDGVELTGINVLNEQSLTGYTPPGVAGTADIRVTTSSGVYEANNAFIYRATGDSFAGGMSGGPIQGTANIVVVDSNSQNGIPGAFVVLGDPATSPYRGVTDALGQITFSDPALVGPVTVTAAAESYETSTFVQYNAENITIFLRTPPPPANGPLPPGAQAGHIFGHVLFGDATSVGSPVWHLVPEPRTPTERKRVYVTTTARSPFAVAFAPTRYIDYEYDPNVVAWEYDAFVRPGATALVAIAGLYDSARDPSGLGVSGFEPFAMGITRGILVGPGETRIGVDVIVDIPLDAALRVQLDAPPALGNPDFPGPTYYKIRPFIDLGGEGVIHMNKNSIRTPPAPEDRPNHYRFPEGTDSIVLGGMAPLTGVLSDASYGFFVGAYTGADANPFSVRVVRGTSDITRPLEIGQFLGMLRPSDPLPDSVASGLGFRTYSEGPADGEATFNMHLFATREGQQLWRVFTPGDVFDVEIPDVTSAGLPAFPTGIDIDWTMWRIAVSGSTYNQFTYRHLSSLYWDAYAADAIFVQFPPQQ